MDDMTFYKKLIEFTKSKSFEFIWFCRCVEEVYVGMCVSDEEKTSTAIRFRSKNMIDSINKERLEYNEAYKCTSNILNVLNKYLIKKGS